MRSKIGVLLLMFVLVASQNIIAQVKKNAEDSCYSQKRPLGKYAFKKMMLNYYNYTIAGSQTPTSGLKIETNKPTITLKGNIVAKRDKLAIVNLELTGGVDNGLLQVFAGDQLNAYFKGSLGFNFLFEKGNDANYTMHDTLLGQLARSQVCQYREVVQKQIDSMIVLDELARYREKKDSSIYELVKNIISKRNEKKLILDNYKNRSFSPLGECEYYKRLVEGMIKRYQIKKCDTGSTTFEEFIRALRDSTFPRIRVDSLHNDMKKYSKFNNRMAKYDLFNDYEIETYKDIWTSKTIVWINLSLSGANSSFRLYDKNNEVIADSNSFIPGISVTYNLLKKWAGPAKYLFLRAGVTARRENNLSDLEKFDYIHQQIITATPTEELKSEKKGTAYVGTLIYGGGLDVPVEFYWAPFSELAIPGLYTKLSYRYSNAWVNRHKVAYELGITWNVTNNDKESKNLLTIVPYISWSNLLPEYKDATKTEKRKLSDLFFVNVRFGIPINLGK